MAMVTIPSQSSSLPQALGTSDSPEFAGLTVTSLSGLVRATAGVLSAGTLVAADIPNLDAAKITTGTLQVARGGTGNGTALTNGQLFVGKTGFAPVLTTLTGTANQLIVTNGAGTITLSLPQSIATTSTVTFDTFTATTSLVAGGTVNFATLGSGTGTALIRDVSGNILELTSTAASKNDIQSASKVINPKIILSLNSRAYSYKANPGIQCFGYVAEEVAKIEPKLVLFKDKSPYSIQYMNFVPLMIDVLKEHEESLNQLSMYIASLNVPNLAKEEATSVAFVEPTPKRGSRVKVLAGIIVAAIVSSLALLPKAFGIYIHK